MEQESTVAGERRLRCESQSVYRFIHREVVVLTILAAITVAAFVLTRRFAVSNETLRLDDARTFYLQGQEAISRGRFDASVSALQQAAFKNPEELTYRRALVNALIATGKNDVARQLLLELRNQRPEDPETNLQLARLEVRRGDRTAVDRYYESAIIGLWRPDERVAQRQVRTEFIEFLLQHGERDRALSELLVLEAGLPDEMTAQISAGQMFLAGGDPRRALDHFERVLNQSPNDATILAGAGEASYLLGDYTRASRYFHAIAESDERVRELRVITDLVLSTDPLSPRLAAGERRHRLLIGVGQVTRRLEACHERGASEAALQPVLTDLHTLDAALTGQQGPSPSSQIADGLDLVARGERLADRSCGTPENIDKALVLIARRHGFSEE